MVVDPQVILVVMVEVEHIHLTLVPLVEVVAVDLVVMELIQDPMVV
tara:strand:+ start:376 stop:513 length:138 start_codon:yes stop_codon:yes gene_type:complete